MEFIEFFKRSVSPIKPEGKGGVERPARMDDAEAEAFIKNRVNLEEIEKELNKIIPGELFACHGVLDNISRLVVELRERLPLYDSVISDDTSGRIVSLFFRELIKNKRRKDKKPLQTYFILGGHDLSFDAKKNVELFIEDKGQALGKTLLVTEVIDMGEATGILTDTLERHNINFDLAAVSAQPNPRYAPSTSRHLFYGKENNLGMRAFWNQNHFAGVMKVPKSKSSHPSAIRPDPLDDLYDLVMEKAPKAREQLKRAAELLMPLLD
jgi:hypothetical protein